MFTALRSRDAHISNTNDEYSNCNHMITSVKYISSCHLLGHGMVYCMLLCNCIVHILSYMAEIVLDWNGIYCTTCNTKNDYRIKYWLMYESCFMLTHSLFTLFICSLSLSSIINRWLSKSTAYDNHKLYVFVQLINWFSYKSCRCLDLPKWHFHPDNRYRN